MAFHVSCVIGSNNPSPRAYVSVFLGPTFNDALANMSRTTSEGLTERYGHIGFEWKHEHEADFAAFR